MVGCWRGCSAGGQLIRQEIPAPRSAPWYTRVSRDRSGGRASDCPIWVKSTTAQERRRLVWHLEPSEFALFSPNLAQMKIRNFCSNSFLARGKVCYICSTTMKRSAPPAVASIGAPGCSGVIYLVLARLPGYMGPPQGSPFTLFIGYEQYYSEHKYYWSIFSLQRPPSPYKSEGFFYCGISSLSYNLSHFERFSSGWNNPYLSGAQVIQRRLLCTKTPKHPLFKT